MLIFLLGGSYTTDDLITKSPLMDVRAYGATGDGVTDDTAAIQATIDAAYTAGGGVVFFPAGTYLVSGLTKTYTAGYIPIIFRGVGNWASRIKASGSSPVFTLTATGNMDVFPAFENLSIDGNSRAAHCIKLTNIAYLTMYRVDIYQGDRGIWFEGSLVIECNQVRFAGCIYGVYGEVANTISPNLCRFTNCIFGTCTSFATYWSGGNQLRFDGCDFEGNGTSGDSTTGVIKRENVALAGSHTIIDKCWFESNHGKADVWALSAHASSSLIIRDTLMYSTDVDYNVYADTNVLLFDGLVALPQGGSVNNENIKTVSCTGGIFNTIAASADINNGVLVFPDPTNFTGNELGIGISDPGAQVHIKDGTGVYIQASGAKLRFGDTTSSLFLKMDNTGDLEFLKADESTNIMHVDAGGKVGFGTTTAPTAVVDINSDILRLRSAKTPAGPGDTGNAGDICWDADYLYVCVATNTWERSALSTWGFTGDTMIYEDGNTMVYEDGNTMVYD